MRAFLVFVLLVATPATAETVAVVHARAWTMTMDQPIDNATITIRNGKIVSVAAAAPAPSDARVLDAGGHPVTPALFGAFTQLGLVSVAAASDTDDRGAESGPLGAAFDVRYAVNSNDLAIEEARAAGMARAVVVPTGSAGAPFDGRAALLRLDAADQIVEAGAVAVAVTVDGNARGIGSRAGSWQLLRNALDEAIRYRALPRDNRPRDQLLNRVDIEALGPVVSGVTPLLIRTHREADIRQAIALSRDYRIKVIIAGGSEAWRAAPALAAANIAVILDPLADLPMSYDEIGAHPGNAAILDRAGVHIAFSVSGQGIYLAYSPAQALREGAGVAVAHGLSDVSALRAITRNPAWIWGRGAVSGALEPGQDADLVIWDGDPLEPATAPLLVLARGREVSLVTRQTRLRDRYMSTPE